MAEKTAFPPFICVLSILYPTGSQTFEPDDT